MQQQLIMVIGRIERALSRLEQVAATPMSIDGDPELAARHERLKAETRMAIIELDSLLAAGTT